MSSMFPSRRRIKLSRFRLQFASMNRNGMFVVAAICKVALLLATTQPLQLAELHERVAEVAKVELANPVSTSGVASRRNLLSRFSLRAFQCNSHRVLHGGATRVQAASPASGHRLPNGLCAPMQC